MDLTQNQINANNAPLRKKHIKIELVNNDLQVLDTLEGCAINGSITANANNTIRRSGNLTLAVPIDVTQNTFLDQVDGLAINYQGKIWIDKRLKIYVGLEKGDEIVWNKMGVFIIDKPVRIFSATEYTISFNLIDLMVVFTGERQGQLTGLGVEISQTDNSNDGFLNVNNINTYNPMDNVIKLTKTKITRVGSTDEYVATLLNDLRTIRFYTKESENPLQFEDVQISLPDIDIKDISYLDKNYEASDNPIFYVLGSDNYLYIYTVEDTTYTLLESINLTNQIPLPYMIYAKDERIFIAHHYGVLVYNNSDYSLIIDKRTRNNTYITIQKMRATNSFLILFIGERLENLNLGPLMELSLSNYADFSNISSEWQDTLQYISATDFDVNRNGDYLALVTSVSPYIMTFEFKIDAYKYIPKALPLPLNNEFNRVSNGSGNHFIFYKNNYNSSLAYIYDAEENPLGKGVQVQLSVRDSNTIIDAFLDRQTASTTPYYLTFVGKGVSENELIKSNGDNRVLLYDAIDKVLSQLSVVKKYIIHPMGDSFKYVPYDIKVGTSATVWDLLNKFKEILSTWQFYFDLDGVFRIEPIPSGANDVVYPLNTEVYISDQNDYDFKNVKNQVVVYGKQNEATFFATDVSNDEQVLYLTFDSLDSQKMVLYATKFGFKPLENGGHYNLTKVVLQSGENWIKDDFEQQSLSSIKTKLFYLNGKWFLAMEGRGLYNSSDGTTWVKVIDESMIIDDMIDDITYGDDYDHQPTYVAIAGSDVFASRDGISWTNGDWSLPYKAKSIVYNQSQRSWTILAESAPSSEYFVAITTRPMEQNWGSPTQPLPISLNSLATNGQYDSTTMPPYVALSLNTSNSGLYYSSDGVNFVLSNYQTGNYQSLVYLNSLWLVGGYAGTPILYSQNGIDWTEASCFKGEYAYYDCFAYGNGKYVCYATTTGIVSSILYSLDGQTWYKVSENNDFIIKIIFSNGNFYARGSMGVYISQDGINWSLIEVNSSSNLEHYSGIAASPDELKIVKYKYIEDICHTYVYTLNNPQNRTQIYGTLTDFENVEGYIDGSMFQKDEIYTIRISKAELNDDGEIISTKHLTFEYFSRLQPRSCLIDDNKDSPFYINRGLRQPNYYADFSKNAEISTFSLWLKDNDGTSSLADGTLITFMRHSIAELPNDENFITIDIYNEDGSVLIANNIPLKSARVFVYGSNNIYRNNIENNELAADYTIYCIKYIASENIFEFQGVSPSVYSLVCSGGEFDNIFTDQLAYERCLWELYQHTNLQDNLTLGIVPDYALDVNIKIPYDIANASAQGVDIPSEEQFFMIKQITFPLGFDSTPSTINAIRLYDDGGLLGNS